jgi:uncharacterized protein
MTINSMKKWMLIIAGTLAVILGTIGIFVPVLPTTPFLLLAAFCYVRSSQRMYRMLMNNHLSGTFLRNYLEDKGMSLRYKIITIGLLWMTMGLTMAFATDSVVLWITLVVVAVGVSIHILSLKTVNNHKIQAEITGKPN